MKSPLFGGFVGEGGSPSSEGESLVCLSMRRESNLGWVPCSVAGDRRWWRTAVMGFNLSGDSQILENVSIHLGGSGGASRQWRRKIGVPWLLAQCAVGETNEMFPLLERMGGNHRCGFD